MEWMRIEQHANDTISTEENLQAAGVKKFLICEDDTGTQKYCTKIEIDLYHFLSERLSKNCKEKI